MPLDPLPRPTTAVFPGYAWEDTDAACRNADARRAASKHLLSLTLALVVMSTEAHAQPAEASAELRFEAVSVKQAQPKNTRLLELRAQLLDRMPTGLIRTRGPGRMQIEEWPLHHMIAAAYRVRDFQIAGPPWMKDQYFTIEATLPAGAPIEQVNEMLQRFLAERFGLTLHRETRELPGFALCVDKSGPKLETAAWPESQPPVISPEEARERSKARGEKMRESMEARRRAGGPSMKDHATTSFEGATMAELARSLTKFTGGLVSDESGLTGTYNISLETWTATGDDPGQTIFAALEKLGLKLTERKITLDFLIVDQISKTPSAN